MRHRTAERSFAATLDALPSVLEFVTNASASGCCSAEEVARLELAVEEAVANVCNHAYQEQRGSVLVRVLMSSTGVAVEIEDEGRRFDPTSRPAPELSEDLDRRRAGGLGIALLRRMVDEVAYRRRGGRNVLRMVLRGRKSSGSP